ncbi:beta-galactosidase [Lacisediminihabitans profunda]|uniref:Beta-galactosidase n=1 Tax=Lacisediminihabitans profunda TaxID=2594790 RepID=A0A5C8UVE3_9MICO|nr:beta-galactosidase [Lacisediminihabitans profunda]TXN32498.1 beta-galactosidase [Lacisediminihabitans profunda]
MTWSHQNGRWPTDGLSYGADYNPEQWGASVWREDVRLMREAGVNMVSLGIFSWGLVEVADGAYSWEWMDEIVDLLGENGIAIDLATPTAAPPGWLLFEHPEVRPVDHDMQPHWPGARLGWCPSSDVFRNYAVRIARAVAERYGKRDHVVMWHVGNEFGGGNARCYCDVSAVAFRGWLREKYGTLDVLNAAWASAFWGHTYRDFEHILPPRGSDSKNPSLVLDFDRFSSNELLKHYLAERSVLKEVTPELPVTTNFMVGAEPDVVDYARWAPYMDIVANDHYTRSPDPTPQQDVAFSGDRMRSMTSERRPWLLLEHSTSGVNWQPRNRSKDPGEMIRNSLSHIAHGADGVLFFQWRASRGGAEQFHSAMVPHAGEDTRVFREARTLGRHLKALAPVQGSRAPQARVGILFDDEAGWAMAKGVKPNNLLPYGKLVRDWHRAFWRHNVGIDVLPPWHTFDGYEVLVIPGLFLVDDDTAQRVTEFAEAGGTVVVGVVSGIVDETNQVRLGGYPGAFRALLGAWSEEILPLQEGDRFELDNGWGGSEWSEHVRIEDADVLARYSGGPLDGLPAVTSRTITNGGRALYVSGAIDQESIDGFVATLLGPDSLAELPAGVEMAVRETADERFTFFINHSPMDSSVSAHGAELLTGQSVDGRLELLAGEVRVVQSRR